MTNHRKIDGICKLTPALAGLTLAGPVFDGVQSSLFGFCQFSEPACAYAVSDVRSKLAQNHPALDPFSRLVIIARAENALLQADPSCL
jgi:hypothetical protein